MTRTDELKSRIKSVMVSLPNRAALDQLCTLYDAEIVQINAMVVQKSEQYIAERKAHETTRAQLAEAKEVLKPFAQHSDHYATAEALGGRHVEDSFWVYVELGDLRRARDFIGRMGK